jgi:Leucine-rich repeat (LRR) protein
MFMAKKIVSTFLFIMSLFYVQCNVYAQNLLDEAALAEAKEYTSMADALKEPAKVFKLSLSGVQTVPADITKLPNLQVLIVSGTQVDLKQVISQISGLPIQELYVRESQLSSLPPEIASLKNLKQLDLSFNKYTTLPTEVSQLGKLQTLNLLENQFGDAEKDKVKKMLPNTKVLF